MKFEVAEGLICEGPSSYFWGLLIWWTWMLEELRLIRLLRNSSFRCSDPKLGFLFSVRSLQNDDFLKSKERFSDEC